MDKKTLANLSIQWHITSKCLKKCRHCYMYEDKRYAEEIRNELNFNQVLAILDDIADFEDKYSFSINNFFITGGDPTLSKNFEPLLAELKRRNKNAYIMGNPETVDDHVLEMLKEYDVRQVQFSLDGLENTHDYYRGKGNFQITIDAIERLVSNGIKATVMFTMTGENANELLPLMDYVAHHTKSNGFAFDMVCDVGNAKNIGKPLDKQTVYDIFNQYLDKKEQLRLSGNPIRIAEKPKIFQLLRYERNEYHPYAGDDFSIVDGCYVGFTCYTILADGAVAACRRFPVIVGMMPEERMEDIFLGNLYLKKFRRHEYFKECGQCEFYKSCRGCPAIAYGVTGDAFAAHGLCYKDLITRPVAEKEWPPSSPLTTDKYEEADIVRNTLHNRYYSEYKQIAGKDSFVLLIGTLLSDKVERQNFFHDPRKYIKENNISDIGERDIAYAVYYLFCLEQNRMSNPMKDILDI